MLRRIRPSFARVRSLSNSSPIHPASGITEDQTEWLNAAHRWGESELAPFSSEWDKNSFFPVETLKGGVVITSFTVAVVGTQYFTRLKFLVLFKFRFFFHLIRGFRCPEFHW